MQTLVARCSSLLMKEYESTFNPRPLPQNTFTYLKRIIIIIIPATPMNTARAMSVPTTAEIRSPALPVLSLVVGPPPAVPQHFMFHLLFWIFPRFASMALKMQSDVLDLFLVVIQKVDKIRHTMLRILIQLLCACRLS